MTSSWGAAEGKVDPGPVSRCPRPASQVHSRLQRLTGRMGVVAPAGHLLPHTDTGKNRAAGDVRTVDGPLYFIENHTERSWKVKYTRLALSESWTPPLEDD